MAPLWTNNEENILRENYGKIPLGQLPILLPQRTKGSILQRAHLLGLKSNQKEMSRLALTKYTHRRDYFHIPNNENCYWAGFIAADGNIHSRQNTLRILLNSQDQDHLENFKECVSYTGNLRNRERTTCIEVSGCGQWILDLNRNFSITRKKTFTLNPPPNLKLEQSLCFIIGYIDGDGCIHVRKRKNRGKWIQNAIFLNLCGTEALLSWVRDTFMVVCPSKYSNNIYRVSKTNTFVYSVFGKRAQNLIKLLVGYDVPKLERKWSRERLTTLGVL